MTSILARSAFLLACLLALTVPSKGDQANKIDVSACFPDILQTHLTTSETLQYRYYFLSIVNQDNYDQVKASSEAQAFTPWGLFSGDFSYFQEQRSHYFALNNESLDYYRTQFTDYRYLPPEWQGVINHCIDRLFTNAGYGVSYFAVIISPYLIRFELKFKSTGKDVPRVRSSPILNGSLDDAGKFTSLYRGCYISAIDSTCPSIDSQSEFFIRRTDPNEKVSINLNLDDPKHSTGLDIDSMPKKVHCEQSYANSPVKEETRVNVVQSFLLDEYYGPENNRYQVWWIKDEFAGKVLSASCTAYDSFNIKFGNDPSQVARWRDEHGMSSNPDWQDNVVRCMGIVQTGNARHTDITAKYQEPKEVCTEIPWPAK